MEKVSEGRAILKSVDLQVRLPWMPGQNEPSPEYPKRGSQGRRLKKELEDEGMDFLLASKRKKKRVIP